MDEAEPVGSLRFPQQNLDADLLTYRSSLPGGGWLTPAAAFVRWHDGNPCLVVYADGALHRYGTRLELIESIEIPWMCHDLTVLHHASGDSQLVMLVSDGRRPNATYAVAVDSEGKTIWRYEPRSGALSTLAPLHGASGHRGILIAHDEGVAVRALDMQGETLFTVDSITWRAKNPGPHEIASHASVVWNRFAAGGIRLDGVNIYDGNGQPVSGPVARRTAPRAFGEAGYGPPQHTTVP